MSDRAAAQLVAISAPPVATDFQTREEQEHGIRARAPIENLHVNVPFIDRMHASNVHLCGGQLLVCHQHTLP